MKLRTFPYFLREAFRSLFRNSLISLASIAIITIALLLFGLFFLFIANLQHLGKLAWDQVEIRVFLEQEYNTPQIVGQQLAALPGVKSVKFIPKEEGVVFLEQILGEKNLFSAEENPLPDCYRLSLTEAAEPAEIARRAAALSGVEEVVYGQAFTRFLQLVLRLGLVVGVVLLCLTVLAVLYLVINTIQLMVFARRQEIEIMKLVGATNAFVRWPFLLEGLMLGLGGAVLASVLLTKGYNILLQQLSSYSRFIPLLSGIGINRTLILALTAMGLCFGGLGSLFSVKRYL